MDDIVVLKDRISKAERERTKEAVREILTNIIDPGKYVGHIGTPWHRDDAWTLFPLAPKYNCYETGILDEKAIQAKKERTTSVLFACNYLLKHISQEDAIFQEPEYGMWVNSIGPVYAHLDAKFSGDHTAALTLMVRRPDGRIQASGYVFHENVKDKIGWIQKVCRERHVRRIWIESNPDKGYTADHLKKSRGGKPGLNTVSYPESQNKHIKIVSYLKNYWNEIIWDPNTDDEYMEQIVDYAEKEEPDDAPDSAASLLREAFYPSDRTDNSALYEL